MGLLWRQCRKTKRLSWLYHNCVCPPSQRYEQSGIVSSPSEPPLCSFPYRWAVRQQWSFSSTVSWPTSSGCWWKASTCTPFLPSPSSPSGSTSGGTYSSAGVWYQGGLPGWEEGVRPGEHTGGRVPTQLAVLSPAYMDLNQCTKGYKSPWNV